MISWFAWVFVVGAAYTANLAAFLTVTRMNMNTTIETIEELSNQDDIQYGIDKLNVASVHFFSASEQPVYKSMWDKMQQPGWMASGPQSGVQRVRNGTYAYIAPRSYVEFINSGQPCDTRTLGLPLFYVNCALAVKRDSPLRKILSDALLRLGENGMLRSLEAKWFIRNTTDACRAVKDKESNTDQSDGTALTPFDLAGLFIILAGGLLVSLVVAVSEYLHKGPDKFRTYGISIDNVLLLLKEDDVMPRLEPALSLSKLNHKPSTSRRNGSRKLSKELAAM